MSSRDRLSRLTADLLAPAVRPAAPAAPMPAPLPTAGLESSAASAPAPAGGVSTERAAAPIDAAAPPDRAPESPSAADEAAVETRFPGIPVGSRVGKRTGPGELLTFRGQMLAAEGELTRLRQRLEQYEGSLPTRKIPADRIVPSRWANRHDASFKSAEFLRFKADIEHAGGNVQPVLVRPLDGEADRYEIVFGHRRHRACLELGLPVLAAIWTEPMSDLELFAAMDRENRERADLSAWEQGAMYRKALEEQMFPSQRRLAESLGVSHTWVRKAIAVAELPEPVVQCFRTPLELQFRHAEEIGAALAEDRKGVLRRAEKLRQSERLSASAVVAALIGKQRGASALPRELRVGDKLIGRLSWDERGQAVIRLQPGVLRADNADRVLGALQATFSAEG